MKQTTQVEIRLNREELHELIEGLIQHGKHRVDTPEGVSITFVRENGMVKGKEKRDPAKAAIEGAEEGGRAKWA